MVKKGYGPINEYAAGSGLVIASADTKAFDAANRLLDLTVD